MIFLIKTLWLDAQAPNLIFLSGFRALLALKSCYPTLPLGPILLFYTPPPRAKMESDPPSKSSWKTPAPDLMDFDINVKEYFWGL